MNGRQSLRVSKNREMELQYIGMHHSCSRHGKKGQSLEKLAALLCEDLVAHIILHLSPQLVCPPFLLAWLFCTTGMKFSLEPSASKLK